MSDLTLDMILCKKKYFPGSHLVEIDQNVLATPIVQTQKETIKQKFMKEGSWIWIEGLQGAKDLNGKLGQIVKFNKNKQRYEVFIPDGNGFNSRDFLPAKSQKSISYTASLQLATKVSYHSGPTGTFKAAQLD